MRKGKLIQMFLLFIFLTGCNVKSDGEVITLQEDSLKLQIENLENEIARLSSPIFSNLPADQIIDYGDDVNLLNLGVTVYDEEDGDLTSSINVNLPSTAELILGNYLVEYSVTDSDGNETIERINLKVKFVSKEFDFIIINDSEIMIIEYYKFASNDAIIPEAIGGLQVTTIANYAFAYHSLSSLIIPEGVETIGDYAFLENQLSSVTIPSSVAIIGDYAFYSNSLESVTILEGATSIGDYAFAENQLISVVIPSSLTTIGEYAFSSNQIESIIIPSGVTTIGEYAFTSNNSLTNIIISEGVTNIGDYAFADILPLTSVTIPSSVTTIGDYAFAFNHNLKSITIPEGVISIGTHAFYENWLTSITIPSSVTTIGKYAFDGNRIISVIILGSSTRFNTEWNDIGFEDAIMPTE